MLNLTRQELIVAIDKWLADKKSPLATFSDFTVILARRNGMALALLPGVGQAETQNATDPLADQDMIAGHNAWGYGKGSQPHGFLFPSWPDGINACTEHLARLIHYGWNGSGPCDTVAKLGSVWVYGDATFQRIPVSWVNVVSAVLVQFGGNPDQISKAPLSPEV